MRVGNIYTCMYTYNYNVKNNSTVKYYLELYNYSKHLNCKNCSQSRHRESLRMSQAKKAKLDNPGGVVGKWHVQAAKAKVVL